MHRSSEISIDLVAPRHPQAYPSPIEGHVMLPGALLSVAARLIAVGVNITITDENLHPYHPTAPITGCSLPGAPSIPVVQGLQRRFPVNHQWLMGGQVCDGLDSTQFTQLFGENALSSKGLGMILGDRVAELPSANDVSLIPAYQKIPDKDMARYLRTEVPFHFSQGCMFRCEHCAADRGREESYRSFEHIQNDLEYLRTRADSMGIGGPIRVFMSNLDVCQNPARLAELVDCVKESFGERPAFQFRGLSTFSSLLKLARTYPDTLKELVSMGLYNLGFGLDGHGKEVWKKTRKPIHSEQACFDTLNVCREFGIDPEILMVCGHADIDTEASLKGGYEFLKYLVGEYHVASAPYVSAPCLPGSNGWKDPKFAPIVRTLMSKPWTFQALDFPCMANELKGHRSEVATYVNRTFRDMCALPGSTTKPLFPITGKTGPVERRIIRATNFGRFERT